MGTQKPRGPLYPLHCIQSLKLNRQGVVSSQGTEEEGRRDSLCSLYKTQEAGSVEGTAPQTPKALRMVKEGALELKRARRESLACWRNPRGLSGQ